MIGSIAEARVMQSDQNKLESAHICIVGAGLSGLRCADILLRYGFRVTILEGRDRIGGRVAQTTLPYGHVADLGANWIHGTDTNPLIAIAKATNTPLHDWSEKGAAFDENAQLLDEGKRLMADLWALIGRAFQYSRENSATTDQHVSLYDFIFESVKHLYVGEEDAERKRKQVLGFAQTWSAIVGTEVEKQSLRFLWLEECVDGHNLFVAGTYASILASIAAPALARANIQLSTKVTHITESPETSTVIVTTSTGKQLAFDEVVMTTPLGWLKRNTDAFSPPLPDRLLSAISSLGWGNLEKCYITFSSSFWLDPNNPYSENALDGLISFLPPNYALQTNPSKAYQECFPLSLLPGSYAHPTLLFYLAGATSIYLTSTLSALTSSSDREAFLISYFQPYYSLLPNYSPQNPSCVPIGFLQSSWATDEFSGYGSYSNFQTGLKSGGEDVQIIRDGCGCEERGLWFAGEHTSSFKHMGTTTGAYWSGEAVGRRIARKYGVAGRDGLVGVPEAVIECMGEETEGEESEGEDDDVDVDVWEAAVEVSKMKLRN